MSAPLTHALKTYPSGVLCDINGEKGSIVPDQIRTVDKIRIGPVTGKLNTSEISEIKAVINQMLC